MREYFILRLEPMNHEAGSYQRIGIGIIRSKIIDRILLGATPEKVAIIRQSHKRRIPGNEVGESDLGKLMRLQKIHAVQQDCEHHKTRYGFIRLGREVELRSGFCRHFYMLMSRSTHEFSRTHNEVFFV